MARSIQLGLVALLFTQVCARAETPAVVDLRDVQSRIRNQGGRDSCTYHPPIEALEAAYRRKGVQVNLSIEHLIWLRNVTAMNTAAKDAKVNENNLAFLTGGGLGRNLELLQKYGVCESRQMPYLADHEHIKADYYRGFDVTDYKWFEPHRQVSLDRFNLDPRQFPDTARRGARYGIQEYVYLGGSECQDVRKLEEILAAGHEVMINTLVAFKPQGVNKGRGAVPKVVWYRAQDAQPEAGNSHAMLLVGYDRARQFFIAMNSWGPNLDAGYDPAHLPEGWKDLAKYRGYTLLHYNFIGGNREAAYIKEVVDTKSDRYHHQQALGLWKYTIETKADGKAVAEGVLAWRLMPGLPKGSLRIGDWFAADHRQGRVNAELSPSEPANVVLYFDFTMPQLPFDKKEGAAFQGTLTLPTKGPGTITANKVVSKIDVLGHPPGSLRLTATQLLEGNPLMGWTGVAEPKGAGKK